MPMLQSHKSSILIAAGTALIVSAGSVGAYVAFEKYIREPLQSEMNTPPIRPIIPPMQAAEVPSFVWPDTDEAANKDLNIRYSALETLKLDVAVAEQAKRLKALRTEVEALSAQRDALQNTPAVPVVEQPTAYRPKPEAYIEVVEPIEPRLMGVFGLDGELRAFFSTPEGKRIVQQGQSFFGSRVAVITMESVSLANGTTFYVGQ